MLDDDSNDRDIRGSQQASPHVVEYIDLQDDKYYKSRAYGLPSIRSRDFNISTSQTRSNGTIVKIQKMPMIHDRGSTSYSYNQDRYQQVNTEDSRQDVFTHGKRNLADSRARKDMTNSPGVRTSSQQLQTAMIKNGADLRLDAVSRDCQRGASTPKSHPTNLRPFPHVQVHNGFNHQVPETNPSTAASYPPQGEGSTQARPSNTPKMGFAALETLKKARPAPFGKLKIDSSSHREKEDQLFVSDSEDQGQGENRLGFQDPNVPGQKSHATQQKSVGKQYSPWSKESARRTQTSSRSNHLSDPNARRKESARLAREFAPTEVCGIFSESRVPAGCHPAKLIRKPSAVKRTRNMACIICDSKFEVKQYVRDHFPKCVQKNGNPNRYSWFDHPTVRNNNGTQSTRLDNGFGPFSKKADDETTAEPTSSPSGLQADSQATVEHRTTGGKGISDATIASWLAAQPENAVVEGEDNHSAETGIETSDSAWQYHVVRQEIPTTDLGLEDAIERKYGPYWTLEEANMKAGEEMQIRDLSPPPGPHPKGWNLQFRKDDNGMDSHTVEVQGSTITTTVTRSKSSSSNTTPLFSPTSPNLPYKSTNLKTPSTHPPRPTHRTSHPRLRFHNPTNNLHHPLRIHPPHHL